MRAVVKKVSGVTGFGFLGLQAATVQKKKTIFRDTLYEISYFYVQTFLRYLPKQTDTVKTHPSSRNLVKNDKFRSVGNRKSKISSTFLFYFSFFKGLIVFKKEKKKVLKFFFKKNNQVRDIILSKNKAMKMGPRLGIVKHTARIPAL